MGKETIVRLQRKGFCAYSALSLLLLEEIKIIYVEFCAQVKTETQPRTG